MSLKKMLKNFYQYVSCPTRRGKTQDLCYGSIKGAYKSLPLPPLGSFDHNCVHLVPTYKTVLKREKTKTRGIKVWTDESVLCLQDCFNCTNWDIFRQFCGEDLDYVHTADLNAQNGFFAEIRFFCAVVYTVI